MSKLLDENSLPSSKSELDLFTVPTTQVAIRRSFWSEVQLQNPCTNDGPYEFRIPPDMYMLDLSKNYIYFVIRITKPDGSSCKITTAADGTQAGDLVLPINLIGKTFFKQIKMYLNGKLISDSGDRYAYRSFLETELNFGRDAKKTQLQAAMYYPDIDENEPIKNPGFKTRMSIFKDSAWVELMAPIHADLMSQERFLINQCELRLELYRNSDSFCLIDLDNNPRLNYKIEVKQMCFYIKKVEVADAVSLAIESMLQNTTVKYPIRRTQITSLHITENRRSTPLNSLFSGALPRRLVVGLVNAEAARGSYKTSPFQFHDFGISEIKITSGTVTLPSTPYKLNFDENQQIRSFVQLFDGLGISQDDKGNMISLNRFKNGCAFFVFELSADGADNNTWELIREGTTSLEIVFHKALPAGGVEGIIYGEFDSLVMIDHSRQTFFDFTV